MHGYHPLLNFRTFCLAYQLMRQADEYSEGLSNRLECNIGLISIDCICGHIINERIEFIISHKCTRCHGAQTQQMLIQFNSVHLIRLALNQFSVDNSISAVQSAIERRHDQPPNRLNCHVTSTPNCTESNYMVQRDLRTKL